MVYIPTYSRSQRTKQVPYPPSLVLQGGTKYILAVHFVMWLNFGGILLGRSVQNYISLSVALAPKVVIRNAHALRYVRIRHCVHVTFCGQSPSFIRGVTSRDHARTLARGNLFSLPSLLFVCCPRRSPVRQFIRQALYKNSSVL